MATAGQRTVIPLANWGDFDRSLAAVLASHCGARDAATLTGTADSPNVDRPTACTEGMNERVGAEQSDRFGCARSVHP